MDDGMEDLDQIRSRIRNEARQRRRQKFLLERAARAIPSISRSTNRANGSCDSSRSSSPDLLASPPPDDRLLKYGASDDAELKGRLDSSSSLKLDDRLDDAVIKDGGSECNASLIKGHSDNADLTPPKQTSVEALLKSEQNTTIKIKSKIKRKYNCESSSSEEEDEEEIAKRISHRMALKKATSTATKKSRFHVQSDSDSSTDFVSKRKAQRKRQINTSMVQSTDDLDGKKSNLTDEGDEPTQKMSNTSPISPLTNESKDTVTEVMTTMRAIDSMQSDLETINRMKLQPESTSNNLLLGEVFSKEASHISNGKSGTDAMTIDLTEDSPVKDSPDEANERRNIDHVTREKLTNIGTQPISTNTNTSNQKAKGEFFKSTENLCSKNAEVSSPQSNQSILQFEKKVATHDVFSNHHVAIKQSSSEECTPLKTSSSSPKLGGGDNQDPIIAKHTTTPPNVQWSVQKQCLIVRTIKSNNQQTAPRPKVAGFDLDQTLVQWRCSGWPSQPEHYELWSNSVITNLQKLHDDGYKLVIFSNQGGIRGAFQGKNATRIRALIDWIAELVDRPLFAVCSTKKDGGYHKGNAGMWTIMEEICNGGIQARPELSFFVGDADGHGENARNSKQQQYQAEGVDKLFAENVGKLRGVTMDFFTPDKFFGKSDADKRKITVTFVPPAVLPKEVLSTRAALLGGYLSSTVLLLLVGVQGSGKTMLSKYLTAGSSGWCHYSQDTISSGKPGKREAVEAAAIVSMREGKNVVIDRMHLDAEQRSHFIKIGKLCNVEVHAMVMLASKEEILERVTNRTNHPGRVEGVHCARIAVSSLERLTMPSYDEGFSLISYTSNPDGLLPTAYRNMRMSCADKGDAQILCKEIELYNSGRAVLPMVTFGTMSIGKNDTQSSVTRAIGLGIRSIDTAPTYNNEGEVGLSLANDLSIMVTVKVPRRANSASQARSEIEKSLQLLGRSFADIVLLHWPCDVIEADSLASVWKELETMKSDGICRAIGVCNFSIKALMQLFSICDVKPAINQVERHPLLPQYDLLEFCQSHGVVVQAHTPLGHGHAFLMENETIVQVAIESKLTAAQVLLLWNLQQGVPVVTKFSSDEHGENMAPILKSKIHLTPRQMKAIDEIDESETRFVSPPFMYKNGSTYAWSGSPFKL